MFPALIWEEHLSVNKNIEIIYKELTGLEFNDTYIRWPKIGLVMDDSSGSSLLTNTTENKLFMFL